MKISTKNHRIISEKMETIGNKYFQKVPFRGKKAVKILKSI